MSYLSILTNNVKNPTVGKVTSVNLDGTVNLATDLGIRFNVRFGGIKSFVGQEVFYMDGVVYPKDLGISNIHHV
jgi:hypothetical protein